MRFSTLLTALGFAIAAHALPAIISLEPRSETCDKSPADGRAATLFKQQNLVGESTATDYTPLAADEGCIDLSNLFGAWEGKTRSLVVNAGFECKFYAEFKCPSNKPSLQLGSKSAQVLKKTLPAEWDGKIYSAKCAKMPASALRSRSAGEEGVCVTCA